jgi:protein phosphatase 1 regulatory subunit 37
MEQLKHVLSIQTSPQSTPKAGSNIISSTVGESRVLTSELASIIQETNDAECLEELLNVNDQLLNLLKKVPGSAKPILTLQSLDVAFKNTSSSSDGKLDGTPHINGRPSDRGEESSDASSVEGFEDSPTTPILGRGKERRNLNQKEPEKVLSPRIRISDSEDEDEDGVPYEDALEVPGLHPLIGRSFFAANIICDRL